MVQKIIKKKKQNGGTKETKANFDTIIKPQILEIEHIKNGKIHPFDVKIILLYLRYINYFDEKCSKEYNKLLHDEIYIPILIEPKRRNVNQNTKTNKIGYFNKLKKLHKSLKLRYTNKNTIKTNTKKNPRSKININGDMYIKVFNFIFNTNVGYIDVNEYRDNHNSVLNYYKWIVDYYSFLYKDQPEEDKYKIVRELINEFTFEHDLMIRVFKEETDHYPDHYPIHSSVDKNTLPSELQKIIEENEGKNLHKNTVKYHMNNTPTPTKRPSASKPTHTPKRPSASKPTHTPTHTPKRPSASKPTHTPKRPSASKPTTHPVIIKTPSAIKRSIKNTNGRETSARKKSKSNPVFTTPTTSNKKSDSTNNKAEFTTPRSSYTSQSEFTTPRSSNTSFVSASNK